MKKLDVAIAGSGFGKAVHLKAIKESDYLSAKLFFLHNDEKKSQIESETGISCTNNWNKILNDKDIVGIIIATPPHVRYQLAKEALQRNKHLLLEKPVALHKYEIEKKL